MCKWFISTISIPFKLTFKHAGKTRNKTQSIFIKVNDAQGINGFGESCPRNYVTQESQSSCLTSISQFLKSRETPSSMEELVQWRYQFYNQFSKQYAAWCAIELACLDYLSKKQEKSIFQFLNCETIQIPLYSAVIGINSHSRFLWKMLRYRLFNMQNVKMKISGNISFDQKRIKTLHIMGFTKEQIRLDANNCFANKQIAIDYIQKLSDYFWAIEEPLSSKNLEELIEVSQYTNKTIILDETIQPDNMIKDLEKLKDKKIILNLRISRLGGLLSSIEIVRKCVKKQVPYLIGSHVGETSLLGRADLVLCGDKIGKPFAMEGGFSQRLLTFDPAVPQVAFGYKGNIQNIDKVKSSIGISTLLLKNWNAM